MESDVATVEAPIRILVADDHEVVRIGLKSLLDRIPSFRVVGEAGSADVAVERAAALRPDVILLDLRMPGKSGVEACREILGRKPAPRVIILTSYSDAEAAYGAVMAGASGYMLKRAGSADLVDAIRRVHRGESLLDPSVTSKLFQRMRSADQERPAKPNDGLSGQERRILKLIAQGMTNRAISETLFLSEKTVPNYISAMLSRLGLHNRAEAAAFAVRRGIAVDE